MSNNEKEIVDVEVFTELVDATAEEIAKKQGATKNTTEDTTSNTGNTKSDDTTTKSNCENTTSDTETTTDDDGNPIDMSDVIGAANGENKETLVAKAQKVLQDLISYITSFRFKRDLNKEAKELGVKSKYLKGTKMYSLMQGLADTLHLGITITATMVMNIVDFIKSIIQTVVDLACNILRNIVDFVTLRSASMYE